MSWFERLLRKVLPHKELGWEYLGEKFTRFTLLKTRWFSIYLHKLNAPAYHTQCHDHPWHFWAFILLGGYEEHFNGKYYWRGPGSIMYRPAKSKHNVVTKGNSWSIIVASKKVRGWGFVDCE